MLLLLSLVVLLPSVRAYVDCSMACSQCHSEPDLHIKEVYCAMCRECRERRRERRAMHQALREKEYGWDNQEVQDPPPGCPTPPDCETSVEILHNDVTEATTCYPVTTTTARTCPPIIPCKERKKMTTKVTTTTPMPMPMPPMSPVYFPCIPCMSCPCPSKLQNEVPRTEPTTKKDFFYLYIGFPKDALNKNGA